MFTAYQWATRIVAGLLAPSYLLVVCARVDADPLPVAEVYTLHNLGNEAYQELQWGEYNRVESERPAQKGDRLADYTRYLWVPGTASATLRYVFGNRRSSLGAAVGPHHKPTTYYFPCGASVGAITVGWSEGRSDDQSCAHTGMRINVETGRQAALPQSLAQDKTVNKISTIKTDQPNLPTTSLAQDKTVNKTSKAKTDQPDLQPSLIAQASSSNPFFLYCTVATNHRGWWTRWGSTNDPCREAYQDCFNAGADEKDCKIVSLGNWRSRDQDLSVVAVCADKQIFTRRGDGETADSSLISEVVQQAHTASSKSCIVDVYRPVEVVITPSVKKETLIQASDTNGALVVDALAGRVVVRSALHPEGVTVEVGKHYVYPQDSVEPINVSEVAQSPSVRNFLDPTNWPPTSDGDIKDFKTALGRPVHSGGGLLNVLLPVLGSIGLGFLVSGLTNHGGSNESSGKSSRLPANQSSQASSNSTAASAQASTAVPRISVQPSSLTFTSSNSDTQTQTVTLTNSGSAPLSIGRISISNVFVDNQPRSDTAPFTATTANCLNETIPPNNGHCEIQVNFTPDSGTEYRATLTISSNAGEQTVNLTGTYSPLVR